MPDSPTNQDHRGLAWLIAQLDACGSLLDQATLRQLLMETRLDPAELAAYVDQRSGSGGGRRVIRRESYEVLVFTWKPSEGSAAHDHCGSLCGLKVVRGELTERFFAEGPDGRVRRTTANRLGAGQITVNPGTGVYSLDNSSPDEILVTVHVYSPPSTEVRSYAVAESAPPGLFSRPASAGASVIAIVGGGFTGVMALANLIRFGNKADLPLHIALIDRQPAIGEGIAYCTTDERHLLNVPASRMSAWPDLPGDFYDFARSRNSSVCSDDFLPRKIYGQYVREAMLEVAGAAGEHISAALLRDEVTRLEPSPSSGWTIETAAGRTLHADLTILAVGHRPPGDLLTSRWKGPRTRFVTDPWASPVLNQIGLDEPVLLIGSGLTAIDVILTLGQPDRVAPLIAISRHGLTPAAHLRQQDETADLSDLIDDWFNPASTMTIRRLFSTLRRHTRSSMEAGVEWQKVMDGIRPMIPRLWGSLGVKERARFLRHVRPFWEIHRHRMAPAAADIVDRLRREKMLEVTAGGVVAATADSDGVDVTFSRRGTSAVRTVRVCWVVNCTGPGVHSRHATHPFLRPLLEAGTLCSDELGLGLLTDTCGRAIDAGGNTHPDLLIAGTLRKATLWESTAVPELRQQAQTAARTALAALSSRLPLTAKLGVSQATSSL